MPPILEKKRSILYLCILSISLLLFSCFSLLLSGKAASENETHQSFLPNFSNNSTPCRGENSGLLRVFMYDLPPKFHFGLLGWKGREGQTWPDVAAGVFPSYPGGLTLQHSAEYWLTLDLLSSHRHPKGVIRETNSSLADIVFVPFFSSLSYNKRSKFSQDRSLQDELAEFVLRREEWRRSGGRNHLFVVQHPNSMAEVRKKLSPAMFVVADFARYPPDVTNLAKDVVAPYKHVVQCPPLDASHPFEARPTLLYFHGAIRRKDGGAVREQLSRVLKGEDGVQFAYGTSKGAGRRLAGKGMMSSKFCLHVAGDTPSSGRLFDAIACRCVPVVVSDGIELPFEDEVDYSEFCIFVPAKDAVKRGLLLGILRGLGKEEWTRMWEGAKRVAGMFEYQFPSRTDDAVQMIWKGVGRKMPSVKLGMHRARRLSWSSEETWARSLERSGVEGVGQELLRATVEEEEGSLVVLSANAASSSSRA
ncbi:putative arabinosyltransferase ARAD1 [Wolffia australiana]